MNAKQNIARGIILVLVSIVVAGCASATPVSTPVLLPTTAPLACPTSAPLSCPTALAQVPATPNEWRMGYSDDAKVVVTFDPGGKCSMDVKNPVTESNWSYEIVVNDDTYQNYAVVVMSLDQGKTIKDLEDWNKNNVTEGNPPPFSSFKFIDVFSPLTSTVHWIELTGDPVYFVCIVQGPVDQTVIDEFGPVQLSQ
jgi:hypothetical protein